MKFFLIMALLVISLLSDELVGIFDKLEGDIVVIRRYKQMKVYYGFKIYKEDIIISKRFAKGKIIFLNDSSIKIEQNSRINLKYFLDKNKKYTIKKTTYIQNKEIKPNIKISIIKQKKIIIIKNHKKINSFSRGLGSRTKTTSAKVTIK